VRAGLRADLVSFLGDRGIVLDPSALTVGFARRVAAYKRLDVVVHDPERLGALPVQLVVAGKAHPADDAAKGILRSVLEFGARDGRRAGLVFVENHDLRTAAKLVAGCDVWLNMPTPPLEASGTSGMKAAVNGGLNLSVLDGWWEEAFDGTNGWGIASDPDTEPAERNAADAAALYDLLEHQVLPEFHERDVAGIPRAWVGRIKTSLRTVGPRFCATRMLRDYLASVYP
jgi:starch phosphorylase